MLTDLSNWLFQLRRELPAVQGASKGSVGFFVGGLFNIDGGNAQKFACQQLPLLPPAPRAMGMEGAARASERLFCPAFGICRGRNVKSFFLHLAEEQIANWQGLSLRLSMNISLWQQ